MNCPLQGNRLKKRVPYLKKKKKNANECCRIISFVVSCKRDIPIYLIFQVDFSLYKHFLINLKKSRQSLHSVRAVGIEEMIGVPVLTCGAENIIVTEMSVYYPG